MVKNHLKRIPSPKTWHIKRKTNIFITRPRPGAHSLDLSIALSVFMRTIGKVAKSAKEAKKILNEQEVLVDGKRKKDPKLPVGFMDVISFPASSDYFLILLDEKGRLKAQFIKEDETKSKLSRIESKTKIKKGKTQLNMFDGRNIIVEKDDFKTGSTLQLELPSQKILNNFPLEKGSYIFLIGGKHSGNSGVVQEIKGNSLIYETKEKQKIETAKRYAYVVGKDKPVISL